MFEVFSSLTGRWPILQDIYFYAFAVPVLVVVIVLIRFAAKGVVNRRMKSYSQGAEMMLSFEQLWKKGVITEEEYKAARRKAAEKQLKVIHEEAQSRQTLNMLKAVELNPELARELIRPESGGAKPVIPPEVWSGEAPPPVSPYTAPAKEEFRIISEEIVSDKPTGPLPPPLTSQASRRFQAAEGEEFVPGDPLSAPRLKVPPPPTIGSTSPAPLVPPTATAAGGEIEALYNKGLITREDYERLVRLRDKA